MLLSAFVLLLTSCQEKERFVDVSGGDAVQFIIGSKGSELSKAEYSGVEYTTGESKKVEKIYWKKGDMFRLYSEQALASYTDENKHYADYKALNDTDAENDWAELIQADPTDMGIRYVSGEDDYTFYGMHPSPLAGGIGTGIIKEDEKIKVTAILESEQGFVSATKDDNGDWTVTPDLKWMLMTAETSIKLSETPGGAVSLVFTPLTTAVKFTVTNDTEGEMPIKKVMLISKGTTAVPTPSAISGEFTVDIHGGNTVTTGATTGTEVSIDLSSKNISLAKGKSLTFTFFLAPTKDKIDDLTFRFYKDGSSWMQTRLGYTDGSGIEFPKSKKTIVKGVMLPEGAQWTVKYAPDVDPWYPGGGDPDFKPEFSGDPIVTSWNTGIDAELNLGGGEPEVKFKDLGLPSGTLWADRNIGAKSIMDEPACCGDYYAWSKTETYYEQASSYPPIDVEWKDAYSKGYVQDYGFPYEKYNVTDGLKKLEPIDDVANVVLGGGAQIPSVAQWNELLENCFIVKTINAGYGYVTLTSKINGASIILPAGGFYIGKENTNYGNFGVYYMTSELNTAADLSQVYALHCGASEDLACRLYSRFAGFPVRAVKQPDYIESHNGEKMRGATITWTPASIQNAVRVEMQVSHTGASTVNEVLCAVNGQNDIGYWMGYRQSEPKGWGGSYLSSSITDTRVNLSVNFTRNQNYTLKVTDLAGIVTDVVTSQDAKLGDIAISYIDFFGSGSETGNDYYYGGNFRLFYVKIYDGSGTLIGDLVPVKNGNNYGLYDKIQSREFYGTIHKAGSIDGFVK